MALLRRPPRLAPARRRSTPERLAALARAVEAGTYQPDLQRLAEALVAAARRAAPHARPPRP
jgi:hypothetical protein